MVGRSGYETRHRAGPAKGWARPTKPVALRSGRSGRPGLDHVLTATIRRGVRCERCGECILELEVEHGDGTRELLYSRSTADADGYYSEHRCAPASEHRS